MYQLGFLKNLNFVIISSLLCLLFLTCQEEKLQISFTTLENNLIDSVYLKGKIKNYSAYQSDLFLKIKTSNFLNKQDQFFSTAILKDGSFHLKFPLSIGGIFSLHFAKQKYQLKTAFQDSIYVELMQLENQENFLEVRTTQDTMRIDAEKKVLTNVDDKKQDSIFIKNMETNFSQLAFLEKYHNQDYWDFVIKRKNDLEQKARNEKELLAIKKDTLQIKFLRNFLYQKTSGYEREIILAKLMEEWVEKKSQSMMTPSYQWYLENMESKQLKNYIKVVYENKYNPQQDNIHFLKLTPQKNILETIRKKHQGKVIYIDFWATWCIPCLKEMLIYPKLKMAVGAQVAFVYLAINSPKQDWQSMAKQWDLQGDHYLLSQEEYDWLHRMIYIETIPHYVLLNKQGKIVNDFAPRPSKGEGKEINPVLIKSLHQILVE